MDSKTVTHFFNIISLCFVLVACEPNQSKGLQAIQGSWFYFYDDFYFELHITDTHFIYQSEIMGTEIKQYKSSNDGKIKLYNSENDINPAIIKLADLNTKTPYIEQDHRQFFLNRLDIKKIDLKKLLEADNLYYQEFLKAFGKRQKLNHSLAN